MGKLRWVAAALLAGVVPALAETPGVTDDSVTVGSTSPLTTGVAATCKPVTDGALAWFDKVNADGGVHGRKIINKVLDDQYTAPQALANARQLAEEGVFAFFGGCGSIQPPAVQQVALPEGIPYVFPNAGVVQILGDANYRVLQPPFSDQFHGLAEWTLKKHGAGPAFFVNQRVTSFDENVAAMTAGVEAGGGTVVGSEAMVANEADFTPLAIKVKAAKPDYIIFGTGPGDAARIMLTLEAQGAMPAKFVLGNSSMINSAFLEPLGELANGTVLAAQLTSPPSSPKVQSCKDAFAKFNPDLVPGGQNLLGCAMAQALVAALEDAGKDLTREGFLAAIDAWDNKEVSPILPPITFAGGRHVGMNLMTVAGVENGELKEIEGELLVLPAR